MSENIKVRWLTDHEQTKIAPKTLSTQVMNEDGTHFKDTVENAIANAEAQIAAHASNNEVHVTPEEKEAWNSIEVPSLDGYVTEDYVESRFQTLNSNTKLGFYCIEDVTIIKNDIPTVYPANSNVEIRFVEGDVWEIVPTSNNSILSLTAFPSALGTYYPWLEGVRQFSNILFDMNNVDFYSKWSQGNQGLYQVQFAQYLNCIFWSDNAYVSDLTKRTNYTLYYTTQLPLCYSTIPDNTFKTFFLALGVNSDPNWGNPLYRESFAKANWATQVFSYYGARTVGLPSLDADEFNIVLPKDCRGLMFDARYIENAGVFDAVNTTNFGAKSGSWRDAFGYCISLKSLQIKNLKVNLNISWSPIDYISIKYIIDNAANTNAITISVSPYTYNLLSQADFDLAASKNITIELLTANYVEDKRLSAITNHTHDDIYYTQTEIDTKLASKSDSTHNHDDEYDAKGAANDALDSAKSYADTAAANAANSIKDDLLNGAGTAYDTLKELGDLIDDNVDAIEALEIVAANKADKEHTHDIYETKEDAQVKYNTIIDAKADWSQNDETANDYVKNRTHWVEMAAEEKTATLTPLLEESVYLSDFIPMNIGETIKIRMDGVEETHVVFEAPGTEGVSMMTNNDVFNENTVWLIFGTGNEIIFSWTELNEPHTLSWDVLVEKVHKLDEKFIPDSITEIEVGVGRNVEGETFNIDGVDVVAKAGAEIFNIIEGQPTNKATGLATHAEGNGTIARGDYSHAEGNSTTTYGFASHAEGSGTSASGSMAHAEGQRTIASGERSHAEGQNTTAGGERSHAEGYYTTASSESQHVQGKYNIDDNQNTYAHIVGNGNSATSRSNAHTLDWQGNAWFKGDVYVGSTSGTNKDEGSKKLATEEFVAEQLANISIETPGEYTSIILKSSTPGSNKKFRITIDDDGILSSEEMSE